MRVYYSERFLAHSQGPGHPESPERLKVMAAELKKLGCTFENPVAVGEEELLSVHTREYLSSLKELCSKGARIPDNAFSADTFEIAKLAASAAKQAAFTASNGEFSFALVRPPGHHSGRDFFAGFCYLNNVAFAVRSLQMGKGVGKVLIVDIDYHTGNGTWDIFYDDPSVYYLSFHCDPSVAYPGTGFESENTDHMQNVPLDPSTGDSAYVAKFKPTVEAAFRKFRPDAIAVSAGFDTWKADPIAGLGISDAATYKKIGSVIAGLGVPTFASLEGGYHIPILGRAAAEFASAFI